jgi:tyrosinase
VAVTVELSVNGSTDPTHRYLTWTPYPAQLRLVDPGGSLIPLRVELRNGQASVGRLRFRDDPTEDGEETAQLDLPVDGSPVPFLLSGDLGHPSVNDRDAVIEVVADGQVVDEFEFMVRIRKDAETLTTQERDRFLQAFADLNTPDPGGTFSTFHAMHLGNTNPEAHGRDAFLPWHRAYLLDLERELQKLNAAIALPYWRFDSPAPKVFSADFMGAPSGQPSPGGGSAAFSSNNPLRWWSIDGVPGINRHPVVADPRQFPATSQNGQVRSELALLQLARSQNLDYAYVDLIVAGQLQSDPGFRDYLEGNPHGRAHTSFTGKISDAGTAAEDPLFFMLHCNVDRLWAQWQWHEQRFDGKAANTYFYRGQFGGPGATTRVGHNLHDTMWPWNGVTGGWRPNTAPRQPFLASPIVAGPPATPTVGDLIDYQGLLGGAPQGFDYDDVPFEKVM